MAYCKSCGNPLKDDQRRCAVCGADIEQLETVDDSQIEIVRHGRAGKRKRLSFRNESYDERTLANMFRVLDRKFLLIVFVMLAAFILSFFIRSVERDGLDAPNAAQALGIAAAMLVFLSGCVLHNRGLITLGLFGLFIALLGCAAITFAYFKTGSVNAVVLTCIQGSLQFVLAATALTMFVEMTTGRRCLGLHCFFTVTAAIAILGHITLSLVVNVNNDFGAVMTAWQVLAVGAKILLLTTVLVLFANMAHIGVNESY